MAVQRVRRMRKLRRNCTSCGTTIRRGDLYTAGPNGYLECMRCTDARGLHR